MGRLLIEHIPQSLISDYFLSCNQGIPCVVLCLIYFVVMGWGGDACGLRGFATLDVLRLRPCAVPLAHRHLMSSWLDF
jgi:hypothetical protein